MGCKPKNSISFLSDEEVGLPLGAAKCRPYLFMFSISFKPNIIFHHISAERTALSIRDRK